ncbi:hypothetical protein J1614_001680 [Plenodomus biglobosus]|nr:hypothetical protein J1614_001680 [Plenodomus biglobosus]
MLKSPDALPQAVALGRCIQHLAVSRSYDLLIASTATHGGHYEKTRRLATRASRVRRASSSYTAASFGNKHQCIESVPFAGPQV